MDQKKVIYLSRVSRVSRVYKPETLEERLEREKQRIAEQDKRTLEEFDNIVKNLYESNDKRV